MFSFNFLTVVLAAAQAFAPISAAPLRLSSITKPRIASSKRLTLYDATDCMMQRSDMSLNLAAAMNSMAGVQATVNSSDVRNVQDGIMGAMMSLTILTGAIANGARVDVAIPNSLVSNVTMSINSLDNIAGVPDATTAEALTTARQQLENASQDGMGVAANCVNTGGESGSSSATSSAPARTATASASSASAAATRSTTSASSASATATRSSERRRRTTPRRSA